MSSVSAPFVDRLPVIDAAGDAVQDLASVLFQVASEQLAELAGKLSWLAAHAQAALVAVTAEAEARGVVAESQSSSTVNWVSEHAWQTKTVNAGSIAKASRIARRPELAPVWDQVLSGDLAPVVANVVVAEFDKLAPHLKAEAKEPVLGALLDAGAEHGSVQVRSLRKELFARYAPIDDVEDEHDRCRAQIALSAGTDCGGTWHYELTTDAEGRAVLEAAIGPLSAPQPGPGGERDQRSAAHRRGLALVEVCRRATAAAPGVPTSPKATVMVTMSLADLADQIGSGKTVGARGAGEPLSPSTIRKMACDGGIIPVVLGGDSEILDLGRTVRLFTPGQEAALRLRDRHCTFDGCTIPANWTDKHHLVHWADGGETDIGNAALLCPRHHTIVHRDQLAGHLIDGQVVWDRRPGSYRGRRARVA